MIHRYDLERAHVVTEQSIYLSVIPYRLSVTCCTSKVLTNMSLTPAGRASALWRNQWKTEWAVCCFCTVAILAIFQKTLSDSFKTWIACNSDTDITYCVKTNWHLKVYDALLLYLQLHGRKQHIRALLIDRVMLQHEVRHWRNRNITMISLYSTIYYMEYLCIVSCESSQWKDVSTGVFTRS